MKIKEHPAGETFRCNVWGGTYDISTCFSGPGISVYGIRYERDGVMTVDLRKDNECFEEHLDHIDFHI